jgi:hypothetical protein
MRCRCGGCQREIDAVTIGRRVSDVPKLRARLGGGRYRRLLLASAVGAPRAAPTAHARGGRTVGAPTLDELIVCVCDERHGAYFEIRPQRHMALDVYHHPYAYADLADEYEKEDRRAA